MTAAILRAQLRLQLQPKRPMLKLCRAPEALLICGDPTCADAIRALGWQVDVKGTHLWLDLPEAGYLALAQAPFKPSCDGWGADWAAVQALLTGLVRHGGQWQGAHSVAIMREALKAFSGSEAAARTFLQRLRIQAAQAARLGHDMGITGAARLAADWLWRTQGVGLPPPSIFANFSWQGQ